MKKWLKRIGIGFLVVLILAVGGFAGYIMDYSKAKNTAIAAELHAIDQSKTVHAFLSEASTIGIIFYPGGKVETAAYAPLALQLNQTGLSVFLVDMPFHLAVFDIDAADRVRKLNPQIKTWFIAGHSLGGAMAYSHFEKRKDVYAGIILLAAYPLSKTDRPYLILKGSNDTVLDQSKLEGFDSITIQGGNHAQFGDYGLQKGDGTATISAQAQRDYTVSVIDVFVQANSTQ